LVEIREYRNYTDFVKKLLYACTHRQEIEALGLINYNDFKAYFIVIIVGLKTPKPCTYAQKTWLVEDDAEIADVGRVLCSTVK
jgi:hypothetical protein